MNTIEKTDRAAVQERNLAAIAGEINTIKEQARTYITNSCIEIGRRLCEAKAMIGHGNWQAWLRESVDYNERTAQNLMAIARKFGQEGSQTRLIGAELDAEKVKELNYTQMVALLKVRDDDMRTEMVNSGEAQALSTRELEAKVKSLNAQLEESEEKRKVLEKEKTETARNAEAAEGKAKQAEEERERAKTETERLINQCNELRQEVRELKDRPIETAVVHEIPEETKRKMEEDRQRMEAMEKKLEELRGKAGKEEGEIAFAIAFERVKKDFADMQDAVDAIEDAEKKKKYTGAARKFMELLMDDWAAG